MAAAPRDRREVRRQRQRHLRRPAAQRARQFPAYHRPLPVRLGRRPSGRQIRHQGLADLALDRLRIGRDRDPARRRGDPPRRNQCRALHRHRRLDQSRSADPLFAAFGAVDQQRRPADGGQAVLQEPRRLRHGRGRRRAGAGKSTRPQSARRENPRRHRRAAARWPTPSTAPARARTASRSSAASRNAHQRRRAHAERHRLRQCRTAPARRRTTRWSISAA